MPTEVGDRFEAEIAGGEIEFLVERRIVRNMHLAVLARDRARAIEHDRGVVIQPGCAAFEQRGDDDQLEFLGQRADALGARARNRFGTVEFGDTFVLAEIRPVVQFLQQHQLGTRRGGGAQTGLDRVEIRVAAAAVGFLQQPDLEGVRCHGVIMGVEPIDNGSADRQTVCQSI